MMEYLDMLVIRMQIMAHVMCEKLRDETGDTNLISIVIVLGIVLALVVIFRGYINETILPKIKSQVESFSIDIGTP